MLFLYFHQMENFRYKNPIMKYFSKSVLRLMIGRKTHLQIRTPLEKSSLIFWKIKKCCGAADSFAISLKKSISK